MTTFFENEKKAFFFALSVIGKLPSDFVEDPNLKVLDASHWLTGKSLSEEEKAGQRGYRDKNGEIGIVIVETERGYNAWVINLRTGGAQRL